MPSGPLREVGAGELSVYFIQTKSAIGLEVVDRWKIHSFTKPASADLHLNNNLQLGARL
jgi:hypothetical protein